MKHKVTVYKVTHPFTLPTGVVELILKHYITTMELGKLAKGATVKVKTPEGAEILLVPKFKPLG